ncbi:hypothetical protein FKN04_06430 [Bacillus glycinifermentans]|uniref:hypothetical protein n=1 Tax=Bacillus glycinifermentans TaxID=1664069 RepID=UPI001582B9B8|nr:hypothetical protein [Bacillus glycinifermentans]NUJ16246.1 hypothetical protein [Bacillus glycinifermentans]
MAKLEGVKTLDMVNGEITKVSYDGSEYERIEGNARRVGKPGDLVLNGHRHPDLKLGEFYLLVRDEGTSWLSVRDEVDDFHGNAVTDGNSILFRKVSASQPSLEDRVSTNEKDIAALKSDVAALKGEKEERKRWAAIGREVGEYKAGDVVQYLYDREICEVVDVDEDGRVKVATQNHGTCTENQSSIDLIAPVEARFDRKDTE